MVERVFEDLEFPGVPLRERVDELFEFLQTNPVSEFLFDWIRALLQVLLTFIEDFLRGDWGIIAELGVLRDHDWILPLFVFILFIAVAWAAAGWRLALFAVIGLGLVANLGLWNEGVRTLSIVLAAGIICAIIGIPLGILMSRSNTVEMVVRPVLDFMQTMPAFVYLIPAVALFGLREVPATVATVIFALPPLVRLTNHGIRNVDSEVVEASEAFGSNPWQTLLKVQLPLARPSMMLGFNQTLMLGLSMAVIAAMIGAAGLGSVVLRSLTSLDIGVGFAGGLGIVILAVYLDRVTQGLGRMKGPDETGLFKGFGQSMKRTFSYIIGGPWGREQATQDEEAATDTQKVPKGGVQDRMPFMMGAIFVYHVVVLGLISLVLLAHLLAPPLLDLTLLLTVGLVAFLLLLVLGMEQRRPAAIYLVAGLQVIAVAIALYNLVDPNAMISFPGDTFLQALQVVLGVGFLIYLSTPNARQWFRVQPATGMPA